MARTPTTFTRRDARTLLGLVERSWADSRDQGHLGQLEDRIAASPTVPEPLPPGVVGVGSHVHLTDVDTGERMEFHLVHPRAASVEAGRMSVLAPIAASVLGHSKGDEVDCRAPSGVRRLRIDAVRTPRPPVREPAEFRPESM